MNLISFIFLIPAFICLVQSKDIQFESCGGTVKTVSVQPCDKEPCEIPKGASAVITAHCVSNADAEKLRLSVWADVGGMELSYPGMRNNACIGKNLTCPVSQDQDLVYTQVFEVRKFFPTIDAKAKFELKTNDDQDKVICCFKAPVKVVES